MAFGFNVFLMSVLMISGGSCEGSFPIGSIG